MNNVCLRDQVAGAVEGRPENEILSALLVAIAELKAQLAGGKHTLSGARSALRRIDSSSTKWAGIKRGGLHALEEPVKSEAQSLIRLLKEAGIFVVPVGELESWIDVGTRRKKEWIVLALKSLATVGSPKGVADFIGDVIKYVRNPSQRTSGIDH